MTHVIWRRFHTTISSAPYRTESISRLLESAYLKKDGIFVYSRDRRSQHLLRSIRPSRILFRTRSFLRFTVPALVCFPIAQIIRDLSISILMSFPVSRYALRDCLDQSSHRGGTAMRRKRLGTFQKLIAREEALGDNPSLSLRPLAHAFRGPANLEREQLQRGMDGFDAFDDFVDIFFVGEEPVFEHGRAVFVQCKKVSSVGQG